MVLKTWSKMLKWWNFNNKVFLKAQNLRGADGGYPNKLFQLSSIIQVPAQSSTSSLRLQRTRDAHKLHTNKSTSTKGNNRSYLRVSRASSCALSVVLPEHRWHLWLPLVCESGCDPQHLPPRCRCMPPVIFCSERPTQHHPHASTEKNLTKWQNQIKPCCAHLPRLVG